MLGYEAAMSCPNIQFSTVIGSKALRTNTASVYQSVILGSDAKVSSSGSVQQSVYIGADSGKLSTQADIHNTAVGFGTLSSISDSISSYITAVGSLAGSEITGTNTSSVFVGYSAGSKGNYVSSTLVGARAFGGPTVGNVVRSIIVGSGNNKYYGQHTNKQ